ncbi:unnamed protein product [Phaedon cochleariae]|uniref:Uncharacterized protein n=1 Tax=Phaedon cochleariae TaxID=80249 RepID=A0A9N9SFE5_PHACE|nr:unnamed protein product [Phaedon cochleariae]
MKQEVNTEGIVIYKITKIHDGNVQVKIKRKEEKNRALFRESMSEGLRKVAKVQTKQRTQTFMILDIDETVLEEEEETNDRGLKYAFITTRDDVTKILENESRIGNGWNRWRINEVKEAKRGYKCRKLGMYQKTVVKKMERQGAMTAVSLDI